MDITLVSALIACMYINLFYTYHDVEHHDFTTSNSLGPIYNHCIGTLMLR